jgi:hypothetical protein
MDVINNDEIKTKEEKIEETKNDEVKNDEVKNDEVKNSEVKSEINTLVELIVKIVTNDELMKKYKIILDKKAIDILVTILNKNPKLLGEIKDLFEKIIQDGKIDTNDIPEILILLKRIYELIYSIKNKKISKSEIALATCNIFKFIIHLFIEDEIIKVNNKDDFLKNIDLLIETSISLITLNKSLKTPSCFYKLLKK